MSTPPRKFPPPCWTHDETLALIDAYRDKWYSLRRGNLRTADWDAVAASVSLRCHFAAPSKTSVQCRHKIEKLRQRYRAEKQRCVAYPGRFSPSWVFFASMDSMEHGPNQILTADIPNPDFDFDVKKVPTRSGPNPCSDHEDGFPSKSVGGGSCLMPTVPMANNCGRMNPAGGRCLESFELQSRVHGNIDIEGNAKSNLDFNNTDGDRMGEGRRLRLKMQGVEDLTLSGIIKSKNYGVVDGDCDVNISNGINGDGCFVKKKSLNGGKFGHSGSNQKLESRGRSGRKSVGLDSGGWGVRRGSKRETDPIAEMVSSITMLGEGFVKMEKMKMDMAREMEKMRMEMEIKRSEMLLESQQQIVDAFVSGILEKKKKKAKMVVVPSSDT